MTPRHLAKIKQILMDLRRSPKGIGFLELEGLAFALGRQRVKRGKEPTFIRDAAPRLPSPLSIPGHGGSIKIGTARNIIDTLLADVATWEIFLQGEDDGEGG